MSAIFTSGYLIHSPDMMLEGKGLVFERDGRVMAISDTAVWKWDDEKIIRVHKLSEELDIDYCQLIQRGNEIFVFDRKQSKLAYSAGEATFAFIAIPKFKIPTAFHSAEKDADEMVFGEWSPFYLFNRRQLTFTEYPSLMVIKYLRYLRKATTRLSFSSHSILDHRNDSKLLLYHYHGVKRLILEPVVEVQGGENKIGVYDAVEEKHVCTFEAPQAFEGINWDEHLVIGQFRKAYKDIQGCLLDERIGLCYADAFYVLSYTGAVLERRVPPPGMQFDSVARVGKSTVVLNEYNPATNQTSLAVVEISI